MESKGRKMNFAESLILLLVYVAIFAAGVGKIPTGLSILFCAIVTFIYAVYVLKIPYDDMYGSVMAVFQRGMGSVLILFMVGFISASWLASGTIPTLIVYGLKLLTPSTYLVAAFIICAIGSLATGSSWSMVATFGVAMMGIAQGMGMPPALAGGAIISGCWIGDKWSPMSDTTNIGAAMNGLNVFDLWRHMLPTSGLAGILCIVIYTVLGFKYAGSSIDMNGVDSLIGTINELYTINPVLLLPIVSVIYLSVKRKPAIPSLLSGVAIAVVLAVLVQGKDLVLVLKSLYNGYVTTTGVASIDRLLSGGGLISVSKIIIIIFCAYSLAGALDPVGAMPAIAERLGSLVKTRGPLTLMTVIAANLGTYLGGTAFTGVILNASMFEKAYAKAGLTKLDLARASLEGSGNTNALVPWCGSHVMIVSCLGLTWTQFIPYYYSLWFGMILMVLYGFTGWFFDKKEA